MPTADRRVSRSSPSWERLVHADQGARLTVSGSAESSETAARRQLIVDLLAPQGDQSGTGGGPSEQEVSTLTQNVADARVLSGEDSALAEQFIEQADRRSSSSRLISLNEEPRSVFRFRGSNPVKYRP